MPPLEFELHREGRCRTCTVAVDTVIVAGWTGRNRTDVQRHIDELRAIGVRPPATVPVFYRVAPNLLTQDNRITVVGPDTSGEAEAYLLATAEGCYVGVGSDHTDRKVEAYDVAVSKQVCAKPISRQVRFLPELREGWDALVLESHVVRDGTRTLYQSGSLSTLLAPDLLIRRYAGTDRLETGTLMFCGTVPVIVPVSGSERFDMRLVNRDASVCLEYAYAINVVPPVELRRGARRGW